MGRLQTGAAPPPPPSVILFPDVPKWLFCFGSFVALDVVKGNVLLFLLDIKYKLGKNRYLMFG